MGLPMSNVIIAMLLKRNIDVMQQIIDLMPESSRMPPRLEETKLQLETVDTNIKGRPELVIPNSDEHSAKLIKLIKKLRHVMVRQKAKGNLAARDFADEDKIYSFFLLKIFVEYKINQGVQAIVDKKLGSARQFYEKALKTLNEEPGFPEYVTQKTQEVYEKLEVINAMMVNKPPEEQLESSEAKDRLEDLELVFTQTKKKWWIPFARASHHKVITMRGLGEPI